ncbi:hypothetical protein [Arenibaculum pallidiluteum]|uniref:hypothetical protein n=1 Tax=Arenibaculum pallidiluteum TaxID=2812559 RepID=UPI001A96E58D|nr:hypothetical protein [Arenibaculum pallidiluteum]
MQDPEIQIAAEGACRNVAAPGEASPAAGLDGLVPPMPVLARREVAWLVAHPELAGLDETAANAIVASPCYREILQREARASAAGGAHEPAESLVLADIADPRALASARKMVRACPAERLREMAGAARRLVAQEPAGAAAGAVVGGFLVVLMELAERGRDAAEEAAAAGGASGPTGLSIPRR